MGAQTGTPSVFPLYITIFIFLLSSVGRANISLCTHELVWETHKFGTDFCAVPPHSSLAQSVERVTVNHDVVGSSPTGGATKTLENIVFSRVFCYLGSSERTSKNPNFKVSELTHPNDC